MQLHWSPTSPYVRKVMACAIARGLDGRIEKIPTNPHESPADLLAHNPLSRVPALVLDDGGTLFDSPVIAEFLDSLGEAPKLFPASGAARWQALRLQALADGMMDAAVTRRGQMALTQDEGRVAYSDRQKAAVARALDALEAEVGTGLDERLSTIGGIAVACALGYLDLRFAEERWRDGHPKLAAWFAEVEKLPAIRDTAPTG